MNGLNPIRIPEQPSNAIAAAPSSNSARFASTREIRAVLLQLKLRPHSQRMLLCRLLRRAAMQANSTISAVNLAVSHHTTTT